MDGRRKLKAQWPPRRINPVTVLLDAPLYEKIYRLAEAGGVSLNDAIRNLIRKEGS